MAVGVVSGPKLFSCDKLMRASFYLELGNGKASWGKLNLKIRLLIKIALSLPEIREGRHVHDHSYKTY